MLIARRLLGRNADPDTAPAVLDRYADTGSAGVLIAFHLHRDDVRPGDCALLCSFGAGYSAGSVLLRRAIDREERPS
jgi:beta-ketodecanoyl-[acyl-carrier-protein] synthase